MKSTLGAGGISSEKNTQMMESMMNMQNMMGHMQSSSEQNMAMMKSMQQMMMNMMAMCTQTMSQRMNNSQASKSTDSGYYGSNENKFTSPPPSARYNTGMGNTSSYTGIGGNTSSTGMGQGNM